METFAVRLKQLREEKGLTQVQLADKVGITMVSISRYESGARQEPGISILTKLANFFNVSIDYLTGDTDMREYTNINDIANTFLKLTEENKRKAISFLSFLLNEQSI